MICIDSWKEIPGYEGIYKISENGEVVSLDRIVTAKDGRNLPIKGKEIKPGLDGSRGYMKVGLSKDGKVETKRVHSLVAKTFLSGSGECVNHIDGNKLNNHFSNLEYTTFSENNQHAYDTGLKPSKCKKFIATSPTGEEFVYEKQADCARDTGISSSYISGCLSGRYKEAKGWTFQRV